MEISTQKTSKEYLCVNSCDIETAADTDYLTCRPAGRIDYHILYVARGVCELEENGEKKKIRAGSIILYRPGEPQTYGFLAADRAVSYYIHFTGAGCEALLRHVGLEHGRVFFIGNSSSYSTVFEHLVSDFHLRRPFWEDSCAADLWQLLSIIGRRLSQAAAKGTAQRHREKRIEEICRRMHREYSSSRPVTDYAAGCCLSASRFTHLFRECTGVSPSRYLTDIRMEKAKQLLVDTDLSVQDAAAMVGFSDANYFSRQFRRSTGYSPVQYRRLG